MVLREWASTDFNCSPSIRSWYTPFLGSVLRNVQNFHSFCYCVCFVSVHFDFVLLYLLWFGFFHLLDSWSVLHVSIYVCVCVCVCVCIHAHKCVCVFVYGYAHTSSCMQLYLECIITIGSCAWELAVSVSHRKCTQLEFVIRLKHVRQHLYNEVCTLATWSLYIRTTVQMKLLCWSYKMMPSVSWMGHLINRIN